MTHPDPPRARAPEEENELLRKRVAELEAALRTSQRTLQTLIDHMPALVYARDREWKLTLINRVVAAYIGLEPSAILGKPETDFFPPELVETWRVTDEKILATGEVVDVEESAPHEDGIHTHRSIKFPLCDDAGAIYAVGGISIDMTAQRRAEEKERRLQAEVIEAQREAIRELSTPLIPLSAGAVVVPLVGQMNEQRAQQFMETLLDGVVGQKAKVVIVDVTGLSEIDADVAASLMRAAQAASLLGAEVVMTGIGPLVAQTLIRVGVDLKQVVTLRSVQDGIAYALKRRKTAS